ncbi:ImuA family protein [Arenibaculum pallidiluteum]|uniref:ImuA family protein n=1 Tax=Arenibaculum pallidiluteum TaxID=2812559 RepID=UPI001A97281C|nr:hypothetical protein [Arenibaculum pallidiluteum]
MTDPMPIPAAGKAVLLEDLRRRIRRLEGTAGEGGRVLPLGPALGAALPEGGLPLGCLHEVSAGTGPGEDPWGGAATGFAAALAGRIAALHGPVLWVRRAEARRGAAEPYAPGLAAWGLGPERLIVVRARAEAEILWALEEALRCRGLGAVLAEVDGIDATAGRRLQLAAEAGGVTALLLRLGRRRAPASAAVTRWAVSAAPGRVVRTPDGADEPGVGAPRWRVELLRCRGGRPGVWLAEWRGEDFAAEILEGAILEGAILEGAGKDGIGRPDGRQPARAGLSS